MLQVNGCLTQAARLQSAVDLLRGKIQPKPRRKAKLKERVILRKKRRAWHISLAGKKRIAQAQRRRWKLYHKEMAKKKPGK